MVKAIAFFKRRAGMAVEEFQTYWLTRHPEVVTRLPGVRRYVQSHTRPAAYRTREPIYDGIAELSFEDSGATRVLRDTPEMARMGARQDGRGELRRAGLARLHRTTEHVIVA